MTASLYVKAATKPVKHATIVKYRTVYHAFLILI